MFEGATAAARVEFQSLARTVVWAAVGASTAFVGIAFVAVAIFIATIEAYGSLWAALAMIAYSIAVAGAAVGLLVLVQSGGRKSAAKRAEADTITEQERAQSAPPLWKDPGVMSTALPIAFKVAQIAFRNRALIGIVASTAALGLALLRETGRNNANDFDP